MNRAENNDKNGSCRAVIENRKSLSLFGIENIVSFDESYVALDGGDALVSVDGEELQILKMDVDSGEVVVVGKINGLNYSDKSSFRRAGRFFARSKRQ